MDLFILLNAHLHFTMRLGEKISNHQKGEAAIASPFLEIY